MTTMKPTAILKKYFGVKSEATLSDFVEEVKVLKQDEESYQETVNLAAAELGVEVDWS